jgi:hypothetical protein
MALDTKKTDNGYDDDDYRYYGKHADKRTTDRLSALGRISHRNESDWPETLPRGNYLSEIYNSSH